MSEPSEPTNVYANPDVSIAETRLRALTRMATQAREDEAVQALRLLALVVRTHYPVARTVVLEVPMDDPGHSLFSVLDSQQRSLLRDDFHDLGTCALLHQDVDMWKTATTPGEYGERYVDLDFVLAATKAVGQIGG